MPNFRCGIESTVVPQNGEWLTAAISGSSAVFWFVNLIWGGGGGGGPTAWRVDLSKHYVISCCSADAPALKWVEAGIRVDLNLFCIVRA